MQVKNYFQKENRKYAFYCLLPCIFCIEIVIYLLLSQSLEEAKGALMHLICPITVITSIVLWVLHFGTYLDYKDELAELTEEQRTALEEATKIKCGKFLLSQEVFIDYGMFSKKVILLENVLSIHGSKGVYRSGSIYHANIDFDTISFTMKNGKKIVVDGLPEYKATEMIYRMVSDAVKGKTIKKQDRESFLSYKIRPPVEGIIWTSIVGITALALGGYSYVMKFFMMGQDAIGKLLFSIGYEGYFWIGALVVIVLSTVALQVWKARKWKAQKRNGMHGLGAGILCTAMMFVWFTSWHLFNEDTKLARKDYQLYKRECFEEVIIDETKISTGIGYDIWGDNEIFTYIESQGMDFEIISGRIKSLNDEEKREAFILLDDEMYSEKQVDYKVRYLKNTKIVVEITE